MKRIFLHAGHFKTGTTSAQNALAAHRELLRAHGVLYPDHGGAWSYQHGLKLALWHETTRDMSLAMLREEADALRAAKEETIILSGETLAACSAENFAELRRIFHDFELIFVFTLRHWAGFCPSRYWEHVRRGDSYTFPQLIEYVGRDFELSATGDMSLPIRRAAPSVDRVVIAPYRAGQALQALYRAFELPEAVSAQIIAASQRDNTIASYLDRECVRLINLIGNQRRDRAPDADYQRSIKAAPPAAGQIGPVLRKAFLASGLPEVAQMRHRVTETKTEVVMRRWAPQFADWTGRLNASLKSIGLDPMPADWGDDEMDRAIAYSDLSPEDIPAHWSKALSRFAREFRARQDESAG